METLREELGRLKTIENTVNEKSLTLKVQPMGGLGAMNQKINARPLPVKKPTTVLFPSPGSSSLPYLSDEQKVKSNETILMLMAHIANQKELRKASYLYDDIEASKLEDRIEDNIKMVANNYTPETKDLLRQYLIKELTKRRQEEDEITRRRMERVDEEINPFTYDRDRDDRDDDENRTHYSGLTPSSGRSVYTRGGSVLTRDTLGGSSYAGGNASDRESAGGSVRESVGGSVASGNEPFRRLANKLSMLQVVRGLKTVQSKKITDKLAGTETTPGLKTKNVQELLLNVPAKDRPKIKLQSGEVREPSDAEVKKLSRRLATDAVVQGLQRTNEAGERTVKIPKAFWSTARVGNIAGGGRPLVLGSGV